MHSSTQTSPDPTAPVNDSNPTATGPLRSPARVAVVGAGFIADFHLEILAATPGVELHAVCDADLERAQGAAKKWKVPHAVSQLGELAELDVDIAHVLVPPALHVTVARELIELGIGVFVEKPLALSSDEARELGELAKSQGVHLAVNHNAVHHPAFAELMERVEEGEIGRVEHVQVTLSVPLRQLDAGDFSHWMFRAPRNIVFEQAPHPAAQLHALIGKVRSCETTLLSSRELLPGQTFHERWSVSAEGERGTAQIYLAFGQPFTRNTIQVIGSDGSIQADLFHDQIEAEGKTMYLDFWNTFLAGWRRGKELRGSALSPLFDYLKLTLGLGERQDAFFAGMRGSIRDLYLMLQGGGAPSSGATEAVEVLEWCEAIAEGVPGDPVEAPTLPDAGEARPGEIVVFGGTGFIGKRVVQGLLDRGLPVTCVVRRAHSLPPLLTDAAVEGRVRLVRGSLEDEAALSEAVRGASCVLQLATGGGASWEAIERSMVGGSRAVGEACLAHGVERLVYVSSTAALYLGADCGYKTIEDQVPPDPKAAERSLYGRGKVAAEKALMQLHEDRGLPVTIVRPAVVLGEGTPMQHSGLGLWVRDNHCVGWGPGDNPLPLVLADDVADALCRIAAHEGKELDGKSLNLTGNPGLTAAEVVAEMREVTGRALVFHPRPLWKSQLMEVGKWLVKKAGRRDVPYPSYRDLKTRALVPTITSRTAREVLGWQPCEEREEFLDRAVRVYRSR